MVDEETAIETQECIRNSMILLKSEAQRRRRYAKCGYDLTGAAEPRCPECGTNTGKVSSDLPQRGNGM